MHLRWDVFFVLVLFLYLININFYCLHAFGAQWFKVMHQLREIYKTEWPTNIVISRSFGWKSVNSKIKKDLYPLCWYRLGFHTVAYMFAIMLQDCANPILVMDLHRRFRVILFQYPVFLALVYWVAFSRKDETGFLVSEIGIVHTVIMPDKNC